MADPYKILGIDSTASDEEITQAWRKEIKTHHPDRGGNADEFRQIQEAYELLSNTFERNRYDRTHPKVKIYRAYTPPVTDFSEVSDLKTEYSWKLWQILLTVIMIVTVSALAILFSLVTILVAVILLVVAGATWLKRNP